MQIQPTTGPYGIYSMQAGWVPAPRYVLRRHRVLELMREMPPGRLLEIGCGSGAMLHDLSAMGHQCDATEHSQSAYDLAVQLNAGNPDVTIHREIADAWQNTFNYVLAFEVLEHIEDDLAALQHWRTLLQPRGYILLSVPAHQRKWSSTDVGAGHFRRYERESLTDVLQQAGFQICELEMYGFPLANMIAPLQSIRYSRKLKSRKLSAAEDVDAKLSNTAHSGVDRSLECKVYPLYSWLPGRAAMHCCCRIQSWFKASEFGNGYLALAQRDEGS